MLSCGLAEHVGRHRRDGTFRKERTKYMYMLISYS